MARSFLILGALLTLLGLAAYAVTGAASVTALIPAFFGVAISGLAFAARRSARPWRWNLGSALLALLGLAGSLGGLLRLPGLLAGAEVARPAAVAAQSTMALLCLAFLVPIIARLSTSAFEQRRWTSKI